jgi:hypothetical protein
VNFTPAELATFSLKRKKPWNGFGDLYGHAKPAIDYEYQFKRVKGRAARLNP